MSKQDPNRLVTIGRFQSVADAELARAILDAEQIPAVVADVNTRLLAPQAVLYVRLQVRASDARRAVRPLRQGTGQHPPVEGEIAELHTCPNCGSDDVIYRRPSWPLVILSVLLLFIPVLVQQCWRCNACGQRWRA